jgi:transcription termination factor Rho
MPDASAANGVTEATVAPTETEIPTTDGSSESGQASSQHPPERSREQRPEPRRQQERQERPDRQERQDRQEGNEQSGILDVLPDGFGFLRTGGYSQSKGDVYVSTSQIKRFNLRRGDHVIGQIRPARDGEKYPALVRIEEVNGNEPQKGRWRPNFDDLTPLYPNERLRLEWKPNDIAPRVIDLVAPIGKGQRGMIVSPPKAGKTTIMQQIAGSIASNYPEVKLMVLLADERPDRLGAKHPRSRDRRLDLRPARR